MKRPKKEPNVSLQTTVDLSTAQRFKNMAEGEGRTVANHLRHVVKKVVLEKDQVKK